MTTCTIIGLVVNCVLSTPPLPPAEAAALVAPGAWPSHSVEQVTPGVYSNHSSVTDGPYGRFTPQPPARRLDGTLVDSPVTVYGQPWWGRSIYASGRPVRGGRPAGGRGGRR